MQTFQEVNDRLRQYWPENLARKAYTLESMQQLMDYLGNPQEQTKIIHVAGTSGKTSTAYYVAALLKACGKRVGLSVSPHVDELNERMQVDLVPMPEAVFCRDITIFLALVEKSNIIPTYFELMTAFAYWQFARKGLEYGVIEVGIGGLIDATNVVTRRDKVCVITDIGLDHIKKLGSTLGEITAHKAGIIQLHNPVFCYRQGAEVMRMLTKAAQHKQADLHVLDPATDTQRNDTLPLFQQRNLGLACAAVAYVLQRDGGETLADSAVAQAALTYIPARMETLAYGDRTILIDGAHNAQKLHALCASLRHAYGDQPIAGLLAFVGGRNRDLDDAAKDLAQLIDHIILTDFQGEHDSPHNSLDPKELAKTFARQGAMSLEVIPGPEQALATLLKRPEKLLLVGGSFYFFNHIRPLLLAK